MRSTLSKASAALLMFSLVAACGAPGAGESRHRNGKTLPPIVVVNDKDKDDETPGAPTVESNTPANMAAGVATDGVISVTFSEEMDGNSLATSFKLTMGNPAVSVPGSVSYAASIAVFMPSSPLANNTVYTATVDTAAMSAADVALEEAHAWSFTTISAAPATGPVDLGTAANFVIFAQTAVTAVANTTIVIGDVGISPGYSADITGFSLLGTDATQAYFLTSNMVTGKVYAADNSAPTPLTVATAAGDMAVAFTDAVSRVPDFTDEGSNGDIGGMILAPGVYSFTHSLAMSTDVTLNGNATDIWIFQVAGDVTMSTGINVLLTGGALPANVVWAVDGKVELGSGAGIQGVVLSRGPITLLDGASVKGRLLSQVSVALYGNTLVNRNKYWDGLGVNLGTAHDFVILSKTGISTVPTSVITGDIGVSPAAASFMTGFDPVVIDAGTEFATSSQVVGKMWASDYLLGTPDKMTLAIGDMETAYIDAASRSPLAPTNLGAGDISGLTLEKGVRYWSTDLLISTDLTLTGSATDVWIFQIAGNLTVANDVKIILSGGALPENVYWQVAGAAVPIDVSIGTGAQFKGIVMSKTDIFVQTGASVLGRLYSQTQVTLQSNVVTEPND